MNIYIEIFRWGVIAIIITCIRQASFKIARKVLCKDKNAVDTIIINSVVWMVLGIVLVVLIMNTKL